MTKSKIFSTDSNFTTIDPQTDFTPPTSLGATLLDTSSGKGEFEEVCWQWLHRLPLDLRLGQIKTLEFTDVEGEHRRFEFDSRLFLGGSDGNNEPVGQVMVSLYRKPGSPTDEVYLELEQVQVWYPVLRGQNIGKSIVENVQILGAKLGVKAITALAMYDGRSVWPKLGFRFGDYLPEPKSRIKFLKAFRIYCKRYGIEVPELKKMLDWDAPQIASFRTDIKILVKVGHPTDGKVNRVYVGLGSAFLLSRRPFFVTYPL